MATANGYGGEFQGCHIVPWNFIAKMYDQLSKSKMNEFIDDLAMIHTDASFYDALDQTTKDELDELTNTYQLKAKEHLDEGNTVELRKDLYNIPSNLYPGDSSNNQSIQGNLDPPRKGTESARSDDATDQAKALYVKYNVKGLGIRSDSSSPPRAKSSDKPPGATKDYVTI